MRTSLLVALLIVGCGGEASRTPPPPDAGIDAPDPQIDSKPACYCPFCTPCNQNVEPTVGAPCTESGQQCEYGDDGALRCNRLYTCGGDLRWSLTPPDQVHCPSSNATWCPPTLRDLYVEPTHPTTRECPQEHREQTCIYAGFLCVCGPRGTTRWNCGQMKRRHIGEPSRLTCPLWGGPADVPCSTLGDCSCPLHMSIQCP